MIEIAAAQISLKDTKEENTNTAENERHYRQQDRADDEAPTYVLEDLKQ